MPIYEYRCDACQHQFDAFQKITDSPLSSCPECGGPVHKMVSRTSFVLKGGGWYATEYGNLKPPQGEAKKSSQDSAAKSSKKADSSKKESSAKAA